MALRIYIKQHSPACLEAIQKRVAAKKIQPLSTTDLMEYRYCNCGWYMYGKSDHGVTHKPHALKVYSYAEAERKRKEANAAPEDTSATATRVRDLVDRWVRSLEGSGNVADSIAIYRRVANRLADFCARRKIIFASDIKPLLVSDLRDEWAQIPMKVSTVNYHVAILRMLFGWGINMELMAKNPAKALKPLKRQRLDAIDVDEEEEAQGKTLPLDQEGHENYRRILAAVEPLLTGKLVLPGCKFACARKAGFLKDPERFQLLLELMYETGLRVSDAVHFRADKVVVDDDCASYTTKQIKLRDHPKAEVTVFIDLALWERLKRLKPLYKNYVFFDGSMDWREFVSSTIWRTLHEIGKAIGMEGLRPHRFRDSFAVNRLNEDVPIDKVSLMLGHTKIETTIRHYSPWTRSRHKNLKAHWLKGRDNGEPSKVVVMKKKQRAG